MHQLRNPHSVLAAFDRRPGAVVEVRLAARNPDGAWREVAERAAAAGVPVLSGVGREREARTRLRRGSPASQGAGRGRVESIGGPRPSPGPSLEGRGASGRAGAAGQALVKEHEAVSLDELFAGVDPAATSGLWLALEHIQDPHNVGAVFRTAAFFGVRGIVVTRDRSAPLNATVYDVASGGIEYVPFAVQTNLARALDLAKERGLWTLGAAEESATDVAQVPRDRPWLLVLGNEEDGLRRLTREKCDMACRVTSRGPIGSLNVSVAAGVLMAALAGAVS
ncbi:MAG: RNA methyltransferase [Planctomycetales bacterium]